MQACATLAAPQAAITTRYIIVQCMPGMAALTVRTYVTANSPHKAAGKALPCAGTQDHRQRQKPEPSMMNPAGHCLHACILGRACSPRHKQPARPPGGSMPPEIEIACQERCMWNCSRHLGVLTPCTLNITLQVQLAVPGQAPCMVRTSCEFANMHVKHCSF